MASIEFACPHCHGQFQLDSPPAGGRVACPLCNQVLAIATELPPPIPNIGAAPSKSMASRTGVVEPPPALDWTSRSGDTPQPADYSILEPLGRQQKDRLRQMRGLAWMIGGILFLAIAAAVLSRL